MIFGEPANYDIRRPGVIDRITASTGGSAFGLNVRLGYLFDLGSGTRLGPIGQLGHDQATASRHTESGDPVLTRSVRRQSLDGLVGSLGGQGRQSAAIAGLHVNAFANLTAEHDFYDTPRLIVTEQAAAQDLPLNSPAAVPRHRTVVAILLRQVAPARAIHGSASTNNRLLHRCPRRPRRPPGTKPCRRSH